MKKEDVDALLKIVKSYPRKHEIGFTTKEIPNMISEKFPTIDYDKFNKALGIVTGIMIDGDFIIYTHDVILGLKCAIENRMPTMFEWD